MTTIIWQLQVEPQRNKMFDCDKSSDCTLHSVFTVNTEERTEPGLTIQRSRSLCSPSYSFVRFLVINVMMTLYLCECIEFENKAIFVMSFSRPVENLRCIYIYYIERFSDFLCKFPGSLSHFQIRGCERQCRLSPFSNE